MRVIEDVLVVLATAATVGVVAVGTATGAISGSGEEPAAPAPVIADVEPAGVGGTTVAPCSPSETGTSLQAAPVPAEPEAVPAVAPGSTVIVLTIVDPEIELSCER